MNILRPNGPTVMKSLIDEIERGTRLIGSIDDQTFCRVANRSGSVGAQFRHNLDFVTNLLRGAVVGRIDYSKRERNTRVEVDRRYAIERFLEAKAGLESLGPQAMGSIVSIRSEIDNGLWLISGFAREAEFVHSHTVHHHALIAEKLAGFGIAVDAHFGVAPSTLTYWKAAA